jgi:hypothetical protein
MSFAELYLHFGSAIQVMLAAHAMALVIVNLTKTPKDNEVVAMVYKMIEVLAGIVSPRAKK